MKESLCQELGLQGLLSEEQRSHREATKTRKKSQADLSQSTINFTMSVVFSGRRF